MYQRIWLIGKRVLLINFRIFLENDFYPYLYALIYHLSMSGITPVMTFIDQAIPGELSHVKSRGKYAPHADA